MFRFNSSRVLSAEAQVSLERGEWRGEREEGRGEREGGRGREGGERGRKGERREGGRREGGREREGRRNGCNMERRRGLRDGRQDGRQRLRYIHFLLYYVFSHNCERCMRELTMETSSRMMKKSWALSMSWSRTKILTWREREKTL